MACPSHTSHEQRPWRVLVVDDHPVVREGLVALIERAADLTVCGQADNVREALAEVDRASPGLVLVDLMLQDASGLELIRRLTGRAPVTLVVSMLDDPTWAERALAAGARGYVHKSEAARHIVEAIRAVREGKLWVSRAIADKLLRRHVTAREEGRSPIDALSAREFEVFVAIGRGMTTLGISELLNLSQKTVHTHRVSIKHKLGLGSAAELATAATEWVITAGGPGAADGSGSPGSG